MLPNDSRDVQTSLEKSVEILPEAEAAANHINNDSDILKDMNFELITASSSSVFSDSDPYSGNVLEVVANLPWQNKSIIGIAGLINFM